MTGTISGLVQKLQVSLIVGEGEGRAVSKIWLYITPHININRDRSGEVLFLCYGDPTVELSDLTCWPKEGAIRYFLEIV